MRAAHNESNANYAGFVCVCLFVPVPCVCQCIYSVRAHTHELCGSAAVQQCAHARRACIEIESEITQYLAIVRATFGVRRDARCRYARTRTATTAFGAMSFRIDSRARVRVTWNLEATMKRGDDTRIH